MRLVLPVPPAFSFRRTVLSHGWYALPPFSWDARGGVLRRTLRTPSGRVVGAQAASVHDGVLLSVPGLRCGAGERAALGTQMASCLRLGDDLTGFHRLVRRDRSTAWMARTGSGRLLRAPTVFEDLVKLLCTTNCTWALTTIMVTALVECLGDPGPGGVRDFPTPSALAGTTEARLRREMRTGYRAPSLLRLAEAVATGRLDPEAWRGSPLPTDELYRRITGVHGAGPYAAGNLLKLLGRYEHLGLDSWVRARFAALHHGGRSVTDRTIERRYAAHGVWRGLVFWLEMTRHWHEEKFG